MLHTQIYATSSMKKLNLLQISTTIQKRLKNPFFPKNLLRDDSMEYNGRRRTQDVDEIDKIHTQYTIHEQFQWGKLRSESEREDTKYIQRQRERSRCATRRAINVNHLADAQFNKKGHYDRELEVTSTKRVLSLFLSGYPTVGSRRNPPGTACKVQFIARRLVMPVCVNALYKRSTVLRKETSHDRNSICQFSLFIYQIV